MKMLVPVTMLLLASGPALAQEEEPAPAAPSVDPAELDEARETAAAALKAAEEAKLVAQEAQAAADAASEELAALKAEQEKKEEKKKKKKAGKKTFQGALKEDPGLKIGARVYVLWEMTSDESDPIHEFSVNMARVKFTWTQWKLVEAVLKLDVDYLLKDAGDAALLRDLYVRIQPFTWLGLRMGQFKRPFSEVELMSRRKLPFVNRGIANDWVSEFLGYGDRDIGLMLEGRIWEKIKLDYAVAVFNGMGMNTTELDLGSAKDVVFRIDVTPVEQLTIGANAHLKFIRKDDLKYLVDQDDLDEHSSPAAPYGWDEFKEEHAWMTGTAWMTGGDVKLRFGDMRILAESMFGKSWWFQLEDYRYTWTTTLMLWYRWKLSDAWDIKLEPVLRGEMITLLPGPGKWSARMWQIVPGVNLHLGKYVRVMIDGEFVITQDREPDDGVTRDGLWPGEWPGPWKNTSKLLVQLAFSI